MIFFFFVFFFFQAEDGIRDRDVTGVQTCALPIWDRGILERLDEGAVLGDGGYLLELEKRGYVQAGPFTPEVVLEHPAAVKELHQEFLDAGAEVLQSVAFYASKEKLATTGFADRVGEINRAAVR